MFQSIPTEKIIAVIERQGAVQPLDVRRALGEGDTMLIGAILSQMHSSGKVSISRTKRGGSPFYYLPERPESLEALAQFLGEKDNRTFHLLRERKVLRADEQEPLVRVSLQNIPDFSRAFTVNEGGSDVLYWRYFLIPEPDAREMISPKKKEAPKAQEIPEKPEEEKKEKQEILESEDDLVNKVQKKIGKIASHKVFKESQHVQGIARLEGPVGDVTYYFAAFSRKTLPEKLVWLALLEARSKGFPLLILKDSPYPKSLAKKFEDVPNVFFERC